MTTTSDSTTTATPGGELTPDRALESTSRPASEPADSKYVIATRTGWEMQVAIDRATEELSREGFGVLTTIDVQATLKRKLDIDVPAQVILGACNPTLAHAGMEAEPDLGALLPCNVVVRQDGDSVKIAAMEPLVALGMLDSPELAPVAREAHDKLARVIEAIERRVAAGE